MAYKIGKIPPIRDIDWTNYETFGYVGSERSQQKKRHITKKENFIRIMNNEGFATGDTFTRKDIVRLRAKYPGMGNPAWLMKFKNKDGMNPYKIGMGTYRLPKLEGVSEVVDVISQYDKKTLERILTAKEHQVVLLRYGINDGIIKTFDEVAEIMELTKQRVWQLNQKALLKLEEHSGTKLVINIVDSTREK